MRSAAIFERLTILYHEKLRLSTHLKQKVRQFFLGDCYGKKLFYFIYIYACRHSGGARLGVKTMKMSEIYDKRRKEILKLCVFNAVAVVACSVCLGVVIYSGKPLSFIPAFAIGVNLHYFFSNLKAVREFEKKKREAEEMEERWQKIFDAEEAKLDIWKTAVTNVRPKRKKKQEKIIYLALHHKKARVRKKNANRIIREEKE